MATQKVLPRWAESLRANTLRDNGGGGEEKRRRKTEEREKVNGKKEGKEKEE